MKTLILWIDAFRYDYLNEKDTPFLYSLANLFGAGRLKPVFGYSSIGASFYSGVCPEKHGQFTLFQYGPYKKLEDYWFLKYTPDKFRFYILNLYRYYFLKKDFFAPNINYDYAKEFSLAQEMFYAHKNSLNVPTLFDSFRDNNLSYLVYNWPYVATDNGSKLTFTFNSSDETKIDEFLNQINKNDKDIYMVHLWDLDKYGHSYGPDSVKLKEILLTQDKLAEKIISEFSLENDNIIIWSDHGMIPVIDTLDIRSYLPPSGDGFTYFLDSTMARFWFFNEKEREKILDSLNQLQQGHVLSADERTKFNINFKDNRYGDEIFLANTGVLLMPNFFQNLPVEGMHGYDLSDEREHGIFILNRPSINKGSIVDLFPTILNMLNISIPVNTDGRDLLK